ncbi:MAG: hypothetical protein DRI61_16630, partial [Chloroflexi bacterium]
MKIKGNLAWLENRISDFKSSDFDVSLLAYVNSSPKPDELAAGLKIPPSDILKLDANENFFIDQAV